MAEGGGVDAPDAAPKLPFEEDLLDNSLNTTNQGIPDRIRAKAITLFSDGLQWTDRAAVFNFGKSFCELQHLVMLEFHFSNSKLNIQIN